MDNIVSHKKLTLVNNDIRKCLKDLIKESLYCSKVTETELNKPFVMTKTVQEDGKNPSRCWIC